MLATDGLRVNVVTRPLQGGLGLEGIWAYGADCCMLAELVIDGLRVHVTDPRLRSTLALEGVHVPEAKHRLHAKQLLEALRVLRAGHSLYAKHAVEGLWAPVVDWQRRTVHILDDPWAICRHTTLERSTKFAR